jgi:hypothetical protein
MFGNRLKTAIPMAGIVALFGVVVGAAFGGANRIRTRSPKRIRQPHK